MKKEHYLYWRNVEIDTKLLVLKNIYILSSLKKLKLYIFGEMYRLIPNYIDTVFVFLIIKKKAMLSL